MYLAAGLCLWYLKAWKIGELEKSGAMVSNLASHSSSHVEEKKGDRSDQEAQRTVSSSFLARLFRWQKV
jgi:hypothetical protein